MSFFSVEEELELSVAHGASLESAHEEFVCSLASIPSVSYKIRSVLLSMLTGELKEIKRYILNFKYEGETITLAKSHFRTESKEIQQAFMTVLEELVSASEDDFSHMIGNLRLTVHFTSQFSSEFQQLVELLETSKLSIVSSDASVHTSLPQRFENLGVDYRELLHIAQRAKVANETVNSAVQGLYEMGVAMIPAWLANITGSHIQADLKAAAREGVTIAAYKYNPRSGVAFRSMAENWVKYYVSKTRTEISAALHVSDAQAKQVTKLNKIQRKLVQEGDASTRRLAAECQRHSKTDPLLSFFDNLKLTHL